MFVKMKLTLILVHGQLKHAVHQSSFPFRHNYNAALQILRRVVIAVFIFQCIL